jgi:NIPSNAP
MIIDLRDYTTAPDARDALIERCETLFFPEQTRLGARLLGVFRDAADANRFVWLRAMADLATRQRVLTAFYSDGALWKAHRDEVNRWIVDSDNVLLMRAASGWARNEATPSMLAMYSCVGREPIADAVGLLRTVAGEIERIGGTLLVTLATDPCDNNYPRHAIRTGETGLVWLARFAEGADCTLRVDGITQRRLIPTAQSWLR